MSSPMNGHNEEVKRAGGTTKRAGGTTKGPLKITETTEEPWKFGGEGDYTVTDTNGTPISVDGAIAIRVLDHGELNLVTDTGRWFLFAPNSWKTVVPTQPKPGKPHTVQAGPGHRP